MEAEAAAASEGSDHSHCVDPNAGQEGAYNTDQDEDAETSAYAQAASVIDLEAEWVPGTAL